jgi:DNA modification methylase
MIDRCHFGDCRGSLRMLAAAGVKARTCVTSPPYFGLRDYKIEPSVWPVLDAPAIVCAHEWLDETVTGELRTGAGLAEFSESFRGGGHKAAEVEPITVTRGGCRHCGAWRGQLGHEPTPELYVDHVVDVFRAIREVLADDGTAWLVIGDSYAGSWGAQGRRDSTTNMSAVSRNQIENHPKRARQTGTIRSAGIKPKDLYGIPWMLAFALRADGWYLRQDIIWHKPNPMPESVTDRCTKSHEYVFLLSKSKRYFYDADAIAEPVSPNTHARLSQDVENQTGSTRANGGTRQDRPMKAVGRTLSGSPHGRHALGDAIPEKERREPAEPSEDASSDTPNDRNKRSVWTIATYGYREAHFATYPPELVEPCILAGSAPGDIVLDPFLGSGTTAEVAKRLGRHWVGCDMNPEYEAMQQRRISPQETLKI